MLTRKGKGGEGGIINDAVKRKASRKKKVKLKINRERGGKTNRRKKPIPHKESEAKKQRKGPT